MPQVRLPVFLLGGSTGPLALARELHSRSVPVHLSLPVDRPELRTRCAVGKHPYPHKDAAPETWSRCLLGPDRKLERAVIFPCDDDAVEFVARHHAELAALHVLDAVSPEHLAGFLDKAETARRLAGCGVRLPRTWGLQTDCEEVFADNPGAILLKPLHSHRFQRVFGSGGRKLFVVHTPAEWKSAREALREHQIDALATEMIPGADSHSTTYYTYRPLQGESLFHFTKRVLRRFPKNQGPGSFHVAQHDEEVCEAGRRVLDFVDYRGYANIEFKRDERDGSLVLIEINPRFTASQELLPRAGVPAGWLVYQALTGGQPGVVKGYRQGLHLWDPARDLRAVRELRKLEEASWWDWMRALRSRRVSLLFRWSDPRPAITRWGQLARKVGSRG